MIDVSINSLIYCVYLPLVSIDNRRVVQKTDKKQ